MQAQSLANSCLCGLHCHSSQALKHIDETVEESCELVVLLRCGRGSPIRNQKTDNVDRER